MAWTMELLPEAEAELLVLHVFVKKTDKTPRRAIETALQRLRRVDDEQDPQP